MTYRRYPHPPVAHARALGIALLALLVLTILAATAAGAAPAPPGHTMRPAVSTTLVVNEIDYDQPGSDTAEFVELKNVSSSSINLDSYMVELVNGTGGGASVYKTVNLPNESLAAGDYYVICGDSANTPNCDLDTSPDNGLVQNGAPDAVAIILSGSVVDTVSYEGDTASPYTEGSGSGLVDADSGSYDGISRYPDGTDSDQNNSDLSLRCITPGEQNTADDSSCPAPEGSATATPTPTSTAAGTPTSTPTPDGTATAAATPTPTPEGTATALATPSPTPVGTATTNATPTATPDGTAAATATSPPPDTATPSPSPPTGTATPSPPPDTATPTPAPPDTSTPTPAPPDTVTPTSPSVSATPTTAPPLTATATSAAGTPTVDPLATIDPLAVELIDLSVKRVHMAVVVRWQTASELKNAGFNVYREAGGGPAVRVNDKLILSSYDPMAGASYSFEDLRAPLGSTRYWLEDVDRRGHATRHGPVLAPPAAVRFRLAPRLPRIVPAGTAFVPVLAPATPVWPHDDMTDSTINPARRHLAPIEHPIAPGPQHLGSPRAVAR